MGEPRGRPGHTSNAARGPIALLANREGRRSFPGDNGGLMLPSHKDGVLYLEHCRLIANDGNGTSPVLSDKAFAAV